MHIICVTKTVFIIAEAGVNHNGSISLAKKLIDAARSSGANAVKFQTFKAGNLVTHNAGMANYQKKNLNSKSNSQYSMLKRLELSYNDFAELKKYCDQKKIEFLSTPFDLESLNFLVKKLKMKKIKLGSGEITNAPLLLAAAHTGLPIILSTGMSTLKEVETAVNIIGYGYVSKNKFPKTYDWNHYFKKPSVLKILKKKLTLLHCSSEYPAEIKTLNLSAMKTLENYFKIPVGYSDHTMGIHIPLIAVGLGAPIIEKHFTLDPKMKGPDHKASLKPNELKKMISDIRDFEKAIGTSNKRPTVKEKSTAKVARKSLVAAKNIRKGEILTVKNLTTKRPGTGLSPVLFWNYIGKKAKQNYKKNDLI